MIIKCIVCNTNLPVPDVVFKFGIPNLTCPYCKSTFKPDITSANQETKPDDKTVIVKNENISTAWLEFTENERTFKYEIKKSENLIGRKAQLSKAEIQIETSDKCISRQHFIIKVIKVPGRVPQYVLSDANSSNHTYIKGEKMMNVNPGDEYLLKNGDEIIAGESVFVFRCFYDESLNSNQGTILIRK